MDAGDTGISFHNHLHMHVVPDPRAGRDASDYREYRDTAGRATRSRSSSRTRTRRATASCSTSTGSTPRTRGDVVSSLLGAPARRPSAGRRSSWRSARARPTTGRGRSRRSRSRSGWRPRSTRRRSCWPRATTRRRRRARRRGPGRRSASRTTARSRVFAGTVRAVHRTVAGTTRVVAVERRRVARGVPARPGLRAQSAGAVVRDLAGKAGVDTGSVDDGPDLPFYVVDDRAARGTTSRGSLAPCGFEAWVDADGALVFGAVPGRRAGADVHLRAGRPRSSTRSRRRRAPAR